MGSRAIVLALAAVLLSCGDRREPKAEPQGSGEGSPASAEQAGERAPSLQRGDRHARAAARRALLVKRVDGTVASVDGRQVVIRRRGAPQMALRVSPRTKVTVNGRPAELDGLCEGAEVRAAYQSGDGGRATALSIEVRSVPGAEAGGGKRRPAPAQRTGG
jgi:hypothetical protein